MFHFFTLCSLFLGFAPTCNRSVGMDSISARALQLMVTHKIYKAPGQINTKAYRTQKSILKMLENIGTQRSTLLYTRMPLDCSENGFIKGVMPENHRSNAEV